MGWWMPIAGAAAGYLIDKKMGGNGLSGAMMGGSLGYGGMGSGASAGGAAGGKGANTAATSLNAGTALGSGGMATAQGASTLGLGSALGTPATTGILGSSTNAIPSYDIGMEGIKSNIGGFTAPLEQNLIKANTYQPLNGGVSPDMSFKQSYIDATPEQGMANLGFPQRPNLNEYPTIMGGEGSSVGIDTTSRDVSGNYETLATSPDFNNITKSSPEELANAQGGYDKPMYEKAFDSMVDFAGKNPIALATLGMTAFGGGSSASPQQVTQSAGKIAQQAYNPKKERILNIRRA